MSGPAAAAKPSRPSTVLVADDDTSILQLLQYNLTRVGLKVITAENGRQAVERMTDAVAVALLDLMTPEMDGLKALTLIKERHPDLPVIMISAHGQIRDAVKAMKQGALEYVTKPFDLDELVCLVQHAVGISRSLREASQLREAVGTSRPIIGFGGASEFTAGLLEQVDRIAPLGSTVLITGESGVGKSLLARVLHYSSPRANGPFISVSCPSLPRELLESEMFGHEKGAFTGALQQRVGRVEMADGGTLFLDEIGDLPLALQPKLLTFLQERTFQRVGGSETHEADVRVIAATNASLKEKIGEREFREDLYFRLNVFALHILPLRQRLDDIEPLCAQILTRIARSRKTEPATLSSGAAAVLKLYPWPGNVRELENVLERATAFCRGQTVTETDLSEEVRQGAELAAASRRQPLSVPTPGVPRGAASETTPPGSVPPGAGAGPGAGAVVGPGGLAGVPLAELERLAIQQTLELCRGNKAEAARRLGVTEKTIYNMIARHGLK